MDDLYRDYILEHYRRPHNFGVLESPTAAYEGANPLCGDRITMQLGIRDGQVAEVAFTGRGCAISQASASLLTDEVKGMTVEQASAFRPADLLELLGIEISPARIKCAMLSLDTFGHALAEAGDPRGESSGESSGESGGPRAESGESPGPLAPSTAAPSTAAAMEERV